MTMGNTWDDDAYDDEEPHEMTPEQTTATPGEPHIPDDGITVTISANALGRISDAAVKRIVDTLESVVSRAVKTRILEVLTDEWKASIGEHIRTAFDEFIAEPALVDGERHAPEWATQILGRYHRIPEGQTPVNEAVKAMVKQYMAENVNKSGARCTDGYYAVGTRVDWLLHSHITEQLGKELEKAVKDVKERATAIVTKQLGAFVAHNLMPPIEVPALPAR